MRIYLNGKPVKFRAECAECGVIAESNPPSKGWEYVELSPCGDWGWKCPECLSDSRSTVSA